MALSVALRAAGISLILPLSTLLYPQVAGRHVIRQVERRLSRACQIGGQRPPGFPRILPTRHGSEGGATGIEKELTGERLIHLRAARRAHLPHLADLLGLLIELEVLGDIEIEFAVAIE